MMIQYGNLIGQKVGIQMALLRSGSRGFLANILGNLTIKKENTPEPSEKRYLKVLRTSTDPAQSLSL
ncbi:hypothetical protein V6Z11_D12G103800 [Gossypium hirsutum]